MSLCTSAPCCSTDTDCVYMSTICWSLLIIHCIAVCHNSNSNTAAIHKLHHTHMVICTHQQFFRSCRGMAGQPPAALHGADAVQQKRLQAVMAFLHSHQRQVSRSKPAGPCRAADLQACHFHCKQGMTMLSQVMQCWFS